MKNRIALLLAVLALAACAPTTTQLYHKQGAQLQVTQRDYDTCKINSLREIPQTIVSEYDPGYNNPGTLSCQSKGATTATGITRTDCRQVGAHYVPPTIRNFDANQGLRDRYMQTCMGDKGYSLMTFPYCENGQVGYNPLTPAPALGNIYCIQPNTPQLQQ